MTSALADLDPSTTVTAPTDPEVEHARRRASARELITRATSRDPHAMENLVPVVARVSLVGTDAATLLDDAATLVEDNVRIDFVVHPLIEALLTLSGASRRGRRTWSFTMPARRGAAASAAGDDVAAFNALMRVLVPASVLPAAHASAAAVHGHCWALADLSRVTDLPPEVDLSRHLGTPASPRPAFVLVNVTTGARQVAYVRFATRTLTLRGQDVAVDTAACFPDVELTTFPAAGDVSPGARLSPMLAAAALAKLAGEGLPVVDGTPGAVAALQQAVRHAAVALPCPAEPGRAILATGPRLKLPDSALTDPLRFAATASAGSGKLTLVGPTDVAFAHTAPIGLAAQIAGAPVFRTVNAGLAGTVVATVVAAAAAGGRGMVSPLVSDLVTMAAAEPTTLPELRGYQNAAVGVHLATHVGYVDALAPGMGKTIVTLVGMRLRALREHARRTGAAAPCLPDATPASDLPTGSVGMITFPYRGLVAVPATLRLQWARQTARWFPEAKVVTVRSRREAGLLAQALDSEGPVVVIASYEMVATVTDLLDEMTAAASRAPRTRDDLATYVTGERTARLAGLFTAVQDAVLSPTEALPDIHGLSASLIQDTVVRVVKDVAAGADLVVAAATAVRDVDAAMQQPLAELLALTAWHDLVVDEAALVLKSTSSNRARALWALRRLSCDVALALTGTPIDKSIDDVAHLLAWVRGDSAVFAGDHRPSGRFDLSAADGAARFARAVGPLLFRRDRSEIADELPQVQTEVVVLEGSPAETKLAAAARSELRAIYTDLQARLAEAEALNPDDERLPEVREALAHARGAVLGGVTLARMAASDPHAVAASESAGAQLLRSRGLVAPAVRTHGTKRSAIVDLVAELADAGESILLFTDFSTVAANLGNDLRARGVTTAAITGEMSERKRDAAAREFNAGEVKVLVATSAAREGLDLQERTTVLVHYELPWSPSAVVQRQARANRFGATAKTLQVLIPIMAGTVEERVASLLVARAATAMAALDGVRGVDVKETEMGLALSGLLEAAKADTLSAGEVSMLDLAKLVLGD